MKTKIFLLVLAAVLLFGSAVPNPTVQPNLKQIVHLAENYNKTLNKEIFVEDVLSLVEAGCTMKFFCKVHKILKKHEQYIKGDDEKKIVKNLKIYIDGTKANCTALLKDEPTSTGTTQIPALLNNIVTCIRKVNMKG